MASPDTQSPANRQIDAVKSAWKTIRACLETERDRIYEEIRNYPPPIAACNQQFTYLLEEHTAILRELAQVTEAEDASLTAGDPIEAIDEFLRSPHHVDADVLQTISLRARPR